MAQSIFSVKLDDESQENLAFVAEHLERKRGDALRWVLRHYARELRSKAATAPHTIGPFVADGLEHDAPVGA